MKQEEKINLSEYSHSILNDELNTMVLAWIEKSGSTTEQEISEEISIDEKKVKNIIVKLFKNQLVEISKDFLKISFKGKRVIDSLNVSNEIVKHFYTRLNLNEQEEYFLNQSINYYRDNYYDNYLNTCHSLKTWDRISQSDKFKHNKWKFETEYFLTVLIHDLFHLTNKDNQNPNLKSFKNLLDDFNFELKKESEEDDFKSKKVFLLLDELYSINKLNDFEKYEDDKKELFHFLFFKDTYLCDEKEQTKFIIEVKNSKDKDLNDHTFWTYSNWKNRYLNDSHFDFNIAKQYFQILPRHIKRKEMDFLDSTIFLLNNSESINDLATKADKTVADTVDILDKIKKRIEELTKKNSR